MKTLDEVIKALEHPSKAVFERDGMLIIHEDDLADALHYLKEYRDREETLRNWTEKAISEQQNLSDAITFMQAYRDDKDDLTALLAYWKEQHENNALTWEQLKQMEGKPVWVEHKGYMPHWMIVDMATDKIFCYFYDWLQSPKDPMKAPKCTLNSSNYGKTWQAYRKERG